jgi:hypothetical protein
VRTTPFTCGCQASVAIKIRITGTWELADSQFPTFGQGYFKRVTSSTHEATFFGPSDIFRLARHRDETFFRPDETILPLRRKHPETFAR